MYSQYYQSFSWRYLHRKVQHRHFLAQLLPSLLTALLIVIFVAQILAVIDRQLENRAIREMSYDSWTDKLMAMIIPPAQAATKLKDEASLFIESYPQVTVEKGKNFSFTLGFENISSSNWSPSGANKVVLVDAKSKKVIANLNKTARRGEVGYFVFKMSSGAKLGTFTKELAVKRGGKILRGSAYNLAISVVEPTVQLASAPAVTAPVVVKSVASAPVVVAAAPTNSAVNNLNTVGADGPQVRIGIYTASEPVRVSASQPFNLEDGAGNVLLNIPAGQTAAMSYQDGQGVYGYGLGAVASTTNSYIRAVSANDQTVFTILNYEDRPAWNQNINDNQFLGSLEIRHNNSKNRTWVINQLPVESYLRGIAETANDAPHEYQKALIVAARTYAVHHLITNTKHADEFFTIDADLDQVYKGYGMQTRLNNIVSAVNETAGQVVTYNGKIAITPYYSWSDGRTRSMKEVWGVDLAWLQSVPEPAGYDKTTMNGHGVGMSAYGGQLLATSQNYNYQQILKYYYTGIDIAQNYNNLIK